MITNKQELELYFKYRCNKGLKKRGLNNIQEYQNRLDYEIGVVIQMGYCGYFLIVSNFIKWAISKDIPVGPGRGSAAGALISYVLEITHIDPIKYKLVFERFLNPSRISPPDIDCDLCEERRVEVIEYLTQKYGTDRVAHIGTYGTMKAKGAIRDVARARGFSYALGDRLSRLTLAPIEGKSQSLATCYEKVPELGNIKKAQGTEENEILTWAERVEDRIRSFGTHASGIVIADRPIHELTPLYPGKDKTPTTQFKMETIERIGLIKFDLLGLRALTTIKRCLTLVKDRHNKDINILNISTEDLDTYKLLQQGNIVGIFQLEGSSGMKELLIQIQPKNLEDLATLVAVYRPGPLGSPELEHYLKVRAGYTTPNYIHPDLEGILGVTDGMLIYQEQVLEICKQMAGYSMSEADLVRRAIGKKKKDLMDLEKDKFSEGMKRNGYDYSVSKRLWNDIEIFSGYGFNKSHAVCYAYISYQMAWLKTHYPIEFLCACLISDGSEQDKVIQYITECRRLGIEILPPSVNESEFTFTIAQGNKIKFGLSTIKNLGKPVEKIIQERRDNGPFKSILDFAERIDISRINRKKIESLVLAGAFDDISIENRASLLAAIGKIWEYKEEQKKYEAKLITYNKKIDKYLIRQQEIEEFSKLEDKKGKKKPTIIATPAKPIMPTIPFIPKIKDFSKFEKLQYEKELINYFISGHPLDEVTETGNIAIKDIKSDQINIQKYKVSLIAIPTLIREITTKQSKKKMAYITLEDKTGNIEAAIFPRQFALFGKLLTTQVPFRYTGVVEITETDTGLLHKLVVDEIKPLGSIQKIINSNLFVTLNISKAKKIVNILENYQGNDLKLNLQLESGESHSWNFLGIGCSENRNEILKKVKEIG